MIKIKALVVVGWRVGVAVGGGGGGGGEFRVNRCQHGKKVFMPYAIHFITIFFLFK